MEDFVQSFFAQKKNDKDITLGFFFHVNQKINPSLRNIVPAPLHPGFLLA
jgi:hypothetical protein